jgi:hypothetical protein
MCGRDSPELRCLALITEALRGDHHDRIEETRVTRRPEYAAYDARGLRVTELDRGGGHEYLAYQRGSRRQIFRRQRVQLFRGSAAIAGGETILASSTPRRVAESPPASSAAERRSRPGQASASSHESQDVSPSSRLSAQLDTSPRLPAPAEPTTAVSRWLAPASSRANSAGLVSSVAGSVVARNSVCASRPACGCPAVPLAAAAAAGVNTPVCSALWRGSRSW